MAKKEKVDRRKHLMTTEDHVKGICEKVNIDHKKVLETMKLKKDMRGKMHDAGKLYTGHDK